MKPLTKNTPKRTSKSTPKSNQSKAKLIHSTIELVEEKGFDAVSLREICAHSNQNLASISYHFGNKDALFQTVINGYYIDIAQLCKNNLVEYQSENETTSLQDILRCFIRPTVMLDHPGISLKLHRAMHTYTLMQKKDNLPLQNTTFKDCITAFTKEIHAACPHISQKQALRLLRLIKGATLNTLIMEFNETEALPSTNKREKMLNQLIDFYSAYVVNGGTL